MRIIRTLILMPLGVAVSLMLQLQLMGLFSHEDSFQVSWMFLGRIGVVVQ